MRSLFFPSSLLLLSQSQASVLVRRDNTQKRTDLKAASNNGNCKIAIVIDSSGSMADSDPTDPRLTAGSNLVNNWLISKSEATSKKPADLVTVINFLDEATLGYPLGGPADANASSANIGADGGTYITSGVEMAIAQLTGSGTGDTAKRSGILVFTDGEESDTTAFVDSINKAARLGNRVSFGFLSSSSQDGQVLATIMHSGGQYSTVYSASTANSFINLVLVNGLITNDNPQGSQSNLLGTTKSWVLRLTALTLGLSMPRQLSTERSLTTPPRLSAQVLFSVSTKKASKFDIKVKASAASRDSIFVIGAISNLPTLNCTVTVGVTGGGLTAGGKADLGIGLTAAFICLGGGAFMLYKHFWGPKAKAPPSYHREPKYIGDQAPHDIPMDAKTIPLQTPQPYYPPAPHAAAPPYYPPKQPPNANTNIEDQPPQNPNQPFDQPPHNPDQLQQPNSPDISDVSDSDSSDSHDKHKRRKRRKTSPDECRCLQCKHCFDCGSRCTPDCTIDAKGNRDCGPK